MDLMTAQRGAPDHTSPLATPAIAPGTSCDRRNCRDLDLGDPKRLENYPYESCSKLHFIPLSSLRNSDEHLRLKVVSNGAASVERVVVKRTGDDVWSVSHNGRSISVHSTEEQALSAALSLASKRKRQGFDAVVVIARER